MGRFFPEIWESEYSLGYFRYTIVIINGRDFTTSASIVQLSLASQTPFPLHTHLHVHTEGREEEKKKRGKGVWCK